MCLAPFLRSGLDRMEHSFKNIIVLTKKGNVWVRVGLARVDRGGWVGGGGAALFPFSCIRSLLLGTGLLLGIGLAHPLPVGQHWWSKLFFAIASCRVVPSIHRNGEFQLRPRGLILPRDGMALPDGARDEIAGGSSFGVFLLARLVVARALCLACSSRCHSGSRMGRATDVGGGASLGFTPLCRIW